MSRSSYQYEPDTEKDFPIIEALIRLADSYPAYGFQMMFNKLRQEGKLWNHKRVYRIYKALKLKSRLSNRNVR